MRKILTDHQRRYPEWRVEDLYKLVHQAAMGSEHAVIDEDRARAWLVRELREMGPGPSEPLVDPIAADGSIVRVHLRPFARLGLDPETLLEAFLRTAREVHGSASFVESGLTDAVRLADGGLIALDAREIELFAGQLRPSGFPAVHHSAAYVAAYRPAYRVVARTSMTVELTAYAGTLSPEGVAELTSGMRDLYAHALERISTHRRDSS